MTGASLPVFAAQRSDLGAMPVDEPGEGLELLGDELAGRVVLQFAGLIVELSGAAANKDLGLVEGQRVQEHHHAAEIILNAAAAKWARRGGLDGDRLAGEGLVGQARDPVD